MLSRCGGWGGFGGSSDCGGGDGAGEFVLLQQTFGAEQRSLWKKI